MNKQDKWLKWMRYGEKLGCHQRPDRSFFLMGYQLPVCARCSGVILGYLVAVPCYFLFGFSRFFSLMGCLLMMADWGLQALQIKEATNFRRLITGWMGGFGLLSFQLRMIQGIMDVFRDNK